MIRFPSNFCVGPSIPPWVTLSGRVHKRVQNVVKDVFYINYKLIRLNSAFFLNLMSYKSACYVVCVRKL